MKQFICRKLPFIIILFLIAGIFSGCFLDGRKISDAAKKTIREALQTEARETGGAFVGKDVASYQAALAFSNEFKTIGKTSLDEDIDFFLWEAAMAKDDSATEAAAQPSDSSLPKLAEEYEQILSSDGVHYTEHSNALGMDLETEYWIKDGKFKILEKSLEKMTLFDGKYYYVIELNEKTALRADKDDPRISADINVKSRGMLSKMTYAGYSQEPDQKVNGFDCSVFYLDIEMMGMKGNRLYVDKKTGMLVKNTFGDEKQGMTTEVTEFQQGGFGDDVFTLPAGIIIN